MADRFANTQPSLSGPASSGFSITPNDATDLAETVRALYVGGGGNLSVTMLSGEVVTLANVFAGSILPLRAVRVRATGTTATDIVGLV
ncbi:hypothetical protein DEM27_12210 [Metarhizobium album]|uniref:Uncharacterized protein n=1 Tax=Metarhizobium album TaxID=2182425 RepID=A0A2U2DSB1_9HYPH|nr:hypothetical protein [Rhizobium album]PWE56187.1 hypothetical protein DEM27_12210 [Rhizobium album]